MMMQSHFLNFIDGAPRDIDVCCKRGKIYCKHPGNQLFQELVRESIGKYANASSKTSKSKIVSNLIEVFTTQGMRFLKQDSTTQRWYLVPVAMVHEKTSHAIRDQMNQLRKSSARKRRTPTSSESTSKSAKRGTQRGKEDPALLRQELSTCEQSTSTLSHSNMNVFTVANNIADCCTPLPMNEDENLVSDSSVATFVEKANDSFEKLSAHDLDTNYTGPSPSPFTDIDIGNSYIHGNSRFPRRVSNFTEDIQQVSTISPMAFPSLPADERKTELPSIEDHFDCNFDLQDLTSCYSAPSSLSHSSSFVQSSIGIAARRSSFSKPPSNCEHFEERQSSILSVDGAPLLPVDWL